MTARHFAAFALGFCLAAEETAQAASVSSNGPSPPIAPKSAVPNDSETRLPGSATPASGRTKSKVRVAFAGEFGLGTLAANGQGAGSVFGRLGLVLWLGSWRPTLDTSLVAWRSPVIRSPDTEWLLSLCPGVGAEFVFAGRRARTKVSLGPAFLLSQSSTLGTTTDLGAFLDLRPVGVLFPLSAQLKLGIDPLGLRLLMPDFSAIPVYETQFLTTVWLEVGR